MENLTRNFQKLKYYLSQRAVSVMGESVLKAFLGALEDYEDSVVKVIGNVNTEISELRNENELLQSLIGVTEPHVKAKILQQGQEVSFLREQLICLKKEYEGKISENEALKLEVEEKKSEIINCHKLREDEQEKFNNWLNELKNQLTGYESRINEQKKEFENKIQLEKKELDGKLSQEKKQFELRKEMIVSKSIRDLKRAYVDAENEIMSAAVKFDNLCRIAYETLERSSNSIEGFRSLVEEGKKTKNISAEDLERQTEPFAQELDLVLKQNRDAKNALELYIKSLDIDKTVDKEAKWQDIFEKVKNSLLRLPGNDKINIVWPETAILPPIKINEKIVIEIFEKLILNAIEAMPDGGALEISADLAGGELSVYFADRGIGIKPEDLSKIFLPFFSTKKNKIGLGLTRAKRLVRYVNGYINYKKRDSGSLFSVSFPFEKNIENSAK